MRRFGASVLIAAAALTALTPVEPASAAQATCQTDIPNDAASDRVFIGVPGEDSAAGIVQSTPISHEGNSTDITVAGVPNPSVGYSGGDVASTNYGAVIASPAGE